MVWICSAESAESPLPSHLGCGRSATSKSTDIARRCSCPVCDPATWNTPQSGMTSRPSTPAPGLERWISFLEDSHARTSARRARALDWRESEAAYFSRSSGYPASSNLHSFFSKMFQQSLLGEEEPLLVRLHPSGMTRDGAFYPLTMWERRTCENGFGYLPTPTTQDTSGRVNFIMTENNRRLCKDGQTHSISLATMAELGILPGHPKGKLHPEWIQQAMIFPKGWTSLKDSETAWFRHVRGKRSKD